MTKSEYLFTLETALRKSGVADAEEIISEYEQHFAFKTADGMSEEEISARLESPDLVAAHYEAQKTGAVPVSGSLPVKIAMGLLAVVEAMLYIVFLAWVGVLAGGAIASLVLGGAVIIESNTLGFLPQMPSLSAIMHGLALISLGAVLGSCSYTCHLFLRQILRSSFRRHAIVTGKTALPSISWVPSFENKSGRRLQKILILSLIALGVTSVFAYVIAMWQAGSPAYWHIWHWFVG